MADYVLPHSIPQAKGLRPGTTSGGYGWVVQAPPA